MSEVTPTSDHTPATDSIESARQLPFAFAKRHGVLLINETQPATLYFRPGVQAEILSEVRRFTAAPIAIERLSLEEFDARLQRTYEQSSDRTMQMMEDLSEEWDLDRLAEQIPETADLLESEDDAPVIRLINALFTEAIKQNASDIHIEPYEQDVAVRIRVDGVMQEILRPQRVLAPLLASRIKVMAKLDIAEKRLPQDGRISLRIAGRAVDVRVSTLPTSHGERVVLRLLDKQAGRLDLTQLDMAADAQETMDQLIQKPHGIILVTGPTGSGKTTTLYAALSRLRNTTRNIMTVEDPIEYHLEGISQTHVNTKVDMTFARGLRAILRQDPDVVMVGEIRDLETAQIAIQASLTGHLVFSTLHTNSAVGTITRLRDMGVEPFLLSSSLLGVLAQRLVRVLCPHCREAYTATTSECRSFDWDEQTAPTLFHAKGCPRCNHTGYHGRTGIYELLNFDDSLRQMVHDEAGEPEIERHIRPTTPSIRDDGIRRILAGETTVEEVLRVTRED